MPTIEIDDRLMVDALAATGLKSEREVVELALTTIIRLKRQGIAASSTGRAILMK